MPDMEADFLGILPAELGRLSQRDVERELEWRFPQYIDDEKLLDIYTKWLVFQIPNLGHHSHMYSSETIRRGCDYLSSRNYNKGLVIGAFSRHKDLFLGNHPEDKKAFNFARRDVEINYKAQTRLLLKPNPSSTNNASDPSIAAVNPAEPGSSQTHLTLVTPATKSTGKAQFELDDLDARSRQRPIECLEEPKSNAPSSAKVSKMSAPSSPKPQMPPANYVCNRCGIPGS
ncbi:WD40 repeatcontaining protein [Colletotrichum tofieldiae]|nr:WD40 repeatcontaining protein [Colletotrichum tofieldiae]GKT80064.1 WD40 repeatcontaining protein [Colletotrichum tofieldiae]GKT85375.1 WD40 repeatcontaining protein [Colletotrichum tofieldiae]